ncbi:DUF5807 family protein [Halapricum hydrolyticum]|uniref:DUF5807 family protein n=1 Tax=Halapricum hydrolyticum TaxID=2979991 RepID=A0AAE3ICI2_9EURY|nr:DUF5807 family protein [Halapricum hydrolyticum]MCU4717152.1 DUF5807 family protein [Halapricum hydrolyticum]MCU4726079.1 DUF5807 family protein [Halapricum hydrolyticum]
MSKRSEFLAGERPDDVAFFLHEDAVENLDALDDYAETVEDGVVLVLPGENGRNAFQKAAGTDPMELAQAAMGTEGTIEPDLTGGTCPAIEDDPEADHTTRVVFAFAEEQNDEVGGIYAEGDVVHAYAVCSCGQRYSQKWVVGER